MSGLPPGNLGGVVQPTSGNPNPISNLTKINYVIFPSVAYPVLQGVHQGTWSVNHSEQTGFLLRFIQINQLSHTCGENYKANYDYAIKNKAKGITSENTKKRKAKRPINRYKRNSRLILR